MHKTKETTLLNFVKDHCSNFGRYYQLCVNDEPCKVLAGERCGYFEKRVLCPPDYKYRIPDIDYAKLFAQYAQLTGAGTVKVKQRRCECGAPLRPKHRFCGQCARIKAKKSSKRRLKRPLDAIEKPPEPPSKAITPESCPVIEQLALFRG